MIDSSNRPLKCLGAEGCGLYEEEDEETGEKAVKP